MSRWMNESILFGKLVRPPHRDVVGAGASGPSAGEADADRGRPRLVSSNTETPEVAAGHQRAEHVGERRDAREAAGGQGVEGGSRRVAEQLLAQWVVAVDEDVLVLQQEPLGVARVEGDPELGDARSDR